MIRLFAPDLPEEIARHLEEKQRIFDASGDYPFRVSDVQRVWKNKNRSNFRIVREKLAEMCPGPRRCHYCEDSCAIAIEHIKPKTLYPEAVFQWSNFLFVCQLCNGRENKGEKFAVFAGPRRIFKDVTRKRNAAILPPVAGMPVLLNPREEDPLNVLELRFPMCVFLPVEGLGRRDLKRAEYTIETLGLNDNLLPQARRGAYESYRALLIVYLKERDETPTQVQPNRYITALKRMHHPTVWAEMKRQHQRIQELQELRDLFARAPEALDW